MDATLQKQLDKLPTRDKELLCTILSKQIHHQGGKPEIEQLSEAGQDYLIAFETELLKVKLVPKKTDV